MTAVSRASSPSSLVALPEVSWLRPAAASLVALPQALSLVALPEVSWLRAASSEVPQAEWSPVARLQVE
jgi:hypothetical protein